MAIRFHLDGLASIIFQFDGDEMKYPEHSSG